LHRCRLTCHTCRTNPRPTPNPYKRHRFPAEIISHGVWLYFRFCLSYRDVEELMAERGVMLTYDAKPRQNVVYVSAERSQPCPTNVTHRIYTCWLSRFEGPLLCTMWLWGLVKLMYPNKVEFTPHESKAI
jgi:hypothetical protein